MDDNERHYDDDDDHVKHVSELNYYRGEEGT